MEANGMEGLRENLIGYVKREEERERGGGGRKGMTKEEHEMDEG